MWTRAIAAWLLASSQAWTQQRTGAPAGVAAPPVTAVQPMVRSPETAAAVLHFRVRVIDGRNGLPIRNAHVKLWYDEPAGTGYEFITDAHGNANMPAPVGEPVRVLVAMTDYADCRRSMRGDPPKAYSVADIAGSGALAENVCGRVAVRPRPGELVLFARPQRWYEGINRGAGN